MSSLHLSRYCYPRRLYVPTRLAHCIRSISSETRKKTVETAKKRRPAAKSHFPGIGTKLFGLAVAVYAM